MLSILGESKSDANFNIHFTIKDTDSLKELAMQEAFKNYGKKRFFAKLVFSADF